MLGENIGCGGGPLVPLSALRNQSGAEVHEGVVGASSTDQMASSPHVSSVDRPVQLIEALLVFEDRLLRGRRKPLDQGRCERLARVSGGRSGVGACCFDDGPEVVDVHPSAVASRAESASSILVTMRTPGRRPGLRK